MAAKIVIVFFLPLLGASLSLPISLDVKTVRSTDNVPESGLTESKQVIDTETSFLRLQEDNRLVQSLSTETVLKAFESFEAVHGKRIKRHITRTSELCPNDMFRYRNWCLTKEQYKEYGSEEGSDDYEAER